MNGSLSAFFQKLAALQSKHSFSFAIVGGNLFADPETATAEQLKSVDDLIEGRIAVPVTTYFNLGAHELPAPIIEKLEAADGEVCENLFFLGNRGTLTTSDKVRIVNLGGILQQEGDESDSTKSKFHPRYTQADARALGGARAADILITTQWPSNVRTGSKKPFEAADEPASTPTISDICAVLKPKYHISVSPAAFYEREPFFHPSAEGQDSDAFHITRFVSLAAFGNDKKAKAILAFNFDPTAAPPVSLEAGITSSPLMAPGRKRRSLPDEGFSRFSVQNGRGGDERHSQHRGKRRRHQHDAFADQQQCFFCTGNPNLATHIIVDIGVRAYITIAKGPLTTSSMFPTLDTPGHVLIIPVEHAPTLANVEERERKGTIAEMHQWRSSLNKMLQAKAPNLGSVVWEVSRGSIRHTHWQFLPLPADLVHKGLLEAAFKVEAENEKYPQFENREPADDEKSDYFRVMTWEPKSAEEKHLLMPLDESMKFDIQFGRKVMAKLLGLEGREDWRNCDQSEDLETADTAKLKAIFDPFTPQMDG